MIVKELGPVLSLKFFLLKEQSSVVFNYLLHVSLNYQDRRFETIKLEMHSVDSTESRENKKNPKQNVTPTGK